MVPQQSIKPRNHAGSGPCQLARVWPEQEVGLLCDPGETIPELRGMAAVVFDDHLCVAVQVPPDPQCMSGLASEPAVPSCERETRPHSKPVCHVSSSRL